jgi:hypothetical protein
LKIKPRNEILNDVIKDAEKHSNNWKAVFGKDDLRASNDYYLYHPNVGLYLLKEYFKNPYEIKGIGSKIARHIDEDIEKNISDFSSNFGILQGDIRKIASNLKKGIQPDQIINAAITGKDLGLKIPLKGHATSSDKTFSTIKEQIGKTQKKINTKFEELASKDGIYQSYD